MNMITFDKYDFLKEKSSVLNFKTNTFIIYINVFFELCVVLGRCALTAFLLIPTMIYIYMFPNFFDEIHYPLVSKIITYVVVYSVLIMFVINLFNLFKYKINTYYKNNQKLNIEKICDYILIDLVKDLLLCMSICFSIEKLKANQKMIFDLDLKNVITDGYLLNCYEILNFKLLVNTNDYNNIELKTINRLVHVFYKLHKHSILNSQFSVDRLYYQPTEIVNAIITILPIYEKMKNKDFKNIKFNNKVLSAICLLDKYYH